MANEIQAPYDSGLVVYAVLLNSTGQAWNGVAFEALQAANWATYALPLTEAAGTGLYLGNLPAVPAERYTVYAYEREGATPAPTDTLVAAGEVDPRAAAYTAARAAKLDYLDAPVSDLPTAAEIDAQLSSTHGGGLWDTGAAVAPDLCRVSDTELSGLGRPVAGRTIRVELVDTPTSADSAIFETEQYTTVSGSDGQWYFDLVQGKKYRVLIPEAGIDRDVTVPAQASATLRSLLV